MKKLLSICMMFVGCFGVSYSFSAEAKSFDVKNYVYDDEGNPLFIKVYCKCCGEKSSHSHKKSGLPSSQENKLGILSKMLQKDQKGSFLVIPIKKKKKNKDDDNPFEKYWECPYCQTLNPVYQAYCSNKNCTIYEEPWKGW